VCILELGWSAGTTGGLAPLLPPLAPTLICPPQILLKRPRGGHGGRGLSLSPTHRHNRRELGYTRSMTLWECTTPSASKTLKRWIHQSLNRAFCTCIYACNVSVEDILRATFLPQTCARTHTYILHTLPPSHNVSRFCVCVTNLTEFLENTYNICISK
jgi:hypothetical protein